MKAYIDVNFTLEEDLSHWTSDMKDMAIKQLDELPELFKEEFYNKFHDYSKDCIKDLQVTITFEDRED